MHVHILNKVWDQKWTDRNIHTVPHTGTHISYNYPKGLEQNVELRLTFTDTYSKQGVGTEMR